MPSASVGLVCASSREPLDRLPVAAYGTDTKLGVVCAWSERATLLAAPVPTNTGWMKA